jgi:hypothetical protein
MTTSPRIETPLQILICDSHEASSQKLKSTIPKTRWGEWVERVVIARSLEEARDVLVDSEANTIFIDPFAFGIEQTSAFIFAVRNTMPSIVFVLYTDPASVERESATFYQGERKRFHHYYCLSKSSVDGFSIDELEKNLLFCMSDLRQNLSKIRAEIRLALLAQQTQPIEIAESIKRYREQFPASGPPVGFLMMNFSKGKAHRRISEQLRKVLSKLGLLTVRADEHTFHDQLLYNVLTYSNGCDFGVAVLDRIENEHHNPNVALEVGYMMALRKPICLLRDRTLKTPQTDLTGMLSIEFDVEDIQKMGKALKRWVESQAFFKRMKANGLRTTDVVHMIDRDGD